jgi:transcriptional regulator with GAF, ATPase, and Fis domain
MGSEKQQRFEDHSSSGRDTDELRALLDISRSLHHSINLDQLLLSIISKIKELMNAEGAAVILLDEAKREFFFFSAESDLDKCEVKLKEIRFPASEGIAGSVLESGKPELINDVACDPRHYRQIDAFTGFQTKSMIVVPLRSKQKPVGVLEVCNKKNGMFDSRDVDFLMTIAGTIAMALDNAKTHDELERAYRELKLIDKAKDQLIECTTEENARLRREVEGRYRFDQIQGNSPKMLELFRLCEKVIGTDISVLIEGETGTGKELIARCIHYNGPRQAKPFVSQNCGGIPDSLLASELFGHKRGAFTGALADKRGLFEAAHGGTIFLDEVAEMSPAMQVSLLRALQEGEIKPLGADQSKKVNVRVISATNRSLEEDVQKGLFREDLFYRLNVFGIHVPPLRERVGDVPLLADYFIKKFNQKNHKTIRGLSREAMGCLAAYPFPGNVRELENEIERSMAMADDGKTIELWNLSERIRSKSACPPHLAKMQGTLKEMVESVEKALLVQMLEEHQGNKTKMASSLGLSRFGLIKKMRRYGFEAR